ncbi:RTA1 like protein-domain-containing protein [Aspergillus varians]
MSTTFCTDVSPTCPVSATTYGYTPNLAANILFACIFGLTALLQIAIGLKARSWAFTFSLAAGCILELVGYIGRIQMHDNVWDKPAFRQQITCLILGPSFIAAGIYWSLKHIVLFLGADKSRLRPGLYPWIFIGCDAGSIVLQAVGGGLAAAGDDDEGLVNAGNNIMVAGIAFQVVTMGICGLLGVDLVYRVWRRRGHGGGEGDGEGREKHSLADGRRFYLFCAAEVWAYVTVLVRCIYRLPEMAGGWGNSLMQNEVEFLILDGAMVAVAVMALTVLHPYWMCPAILTK